MPQQQLALGRLRIVLARREVKVGAVREGQGADRGRFVTNVDADVGEAGVEKGLHPLLDGFGQGLAAAARVEREIPRKWEGIARVRLHGGRGRSLRQDRLRRLRAERRRGLHGAGLRLGRKDRLSCLTGAQRRLKSAGGGTAWNERHKRRARAGLDGSRQLRANRRRGRGRRLDDSRPSAGERTLDDSRGAAGMVRMDRTG